MYGGWLNLVRLVSLQVLILVMAHYGRVRWGAYVLSLYLI